MVIYFDTETSGLRPGQIAQLSLVIQDKEKVTGKNYFFTVDSVDYGAYLVHGFSVEKLFSLSKGRRFSYHAEEIEQLFLSADAVVSHNTAFDFMFMRSEFERLNKVFFVNREFCSMKSLTPVCKLTRSNGAYKYPKLSEACERFGITDTEIKITAKSLFGAECGFHDARFDTTAVYLLCNNALNTDCTLKELKRYI
jgi:DNA polymerase-3 subunit epsilon